MDPAEHSLKEVERNFMTRTMKGATIGLVPGVLWGTLAAAVQVEPPVGKTVVFPGMVPTLKIIGGKGLLCAGTGALWVGVKVLVENHRKKIDVMNDAAGGLVAGTVFAGLRNKSAFMAIYGGIAIANIPVVLENVRTTLKILKTLKDESETGAVSSASGFAYAEFRNTKVIVSIFGLEKAHETKDLSSTLHKALEGAIILKSFPKTTVDVFTLVLESGGSDLPVVISCASLALADTGIESYYMVTSVSVSFIWEGLSYRPYIRKRKVTKMAI